MNGFKQQLAKGKEVEELVKLHLANRGHIIQDVSDIKDY